MNWFVFFCMLLGLATSSAQAALSPQASEQYSRYLNDTLQGLSKLREPTGWVLDRADVDSGGALVICTARAAPSNLGLDLLVLTGIVESKHLVSAARRALGADAQTKARESLSRLLDEIESFPRFTNGLFYSWYEQVNGRLRVHNWDVSSIDNLHLALGLWTVARALGKRDPLGRRAANLLEQMDFSEFVVHAPPNASQQVARNNGMIGGNLSAKPKRDCRPLTHGWCSEEGWSYRYFGAETRSLYSLGWALGVYRHEGNAAASIQYQALKGDLEVAEVRGHRLLKTWDGGAFQMLLPSLLLDEEHYSKIFGQMLDGYSRLALEDARDEGLAVPAIYSASEAFGGKGEIFYHARSGTPSLVTALNLDFSLPRLSRSWDEVVTPHAALLAAVYEPEAYAQALIRAESLQSAGGTPLYRKGLGWMEGYHVRGAYRGEVVPSQLSLDQEMAALALLKILSVDGKSVSGRLLVKAKHASAVIQEFYDVLDERLSQNPRLN